MKSAQAQVVSIVFYWDQEETRARNLELPLLSSQWYLSCIFIVEKGLPFVRTEV